MQLDVFLIGLWQLLSIELLVLVVQKIVKILLEEDAILGIIILLKRWGLLFIQKGLSLRQPLDGLL